MESSETVGKRVMLFLSSFLDKVMRRLGRFFSARLRQDDGQTLMEYAVILLLIALAVIAALTFFGGQVLALYNQVVGSWP
ncbi:MAG: hypothetical protein BWY83_00934 [bacterium ADurb.Bin478]|nr:MAG: hypothetical protein BWY83_00934 [bacterium ADurb.Bin478]